MLLNPSSTRTIGARSRSEPVPRDRAGFLAGRSAIWSRRDGPRGTRLRSSARWPFLRIAVLPLPGSIAIRLGSRILPASDFDSINLKPPRLAGEVRGHEPFMVVGSKATAARALLPPDLLRAIEHFHRYLSACPGVGWSISSVRRPEGQGASASTSSSRNWGVNPVPTEREVAVDFFTDLGFLPPSTSAPATTSHAGLPVRPRHVLLVRTQTVATVLSRPSRGERFVA